MEEMKREKEEELALVNRQLEVKTQRLKDFCKQVGANEQNK
jgi:hypothetical protein